MVRKSAGPCGPCGFNPLHPHHPSVDGHGTPENTHMSSLVFKKNSGTLAKACPVLILSQPLITKPKRAIHAGDL
jgi:hypothetical protein